MSPIGRVHLVFSLIAVGAGAWVLLIRKGTRWHRSLGHLYAMSMAGVVVTAFSIYGMTGTFGPFHFAALVAGVTLIGGLVSVLGRMPRKQWIEAHAIWMSWSYIGLMAAFGAESLTRYVLPRIAPMLERNHLVGAFWTLVAVGSFAMFGIGSRLVKTRLPAAVEQTPAAMRREQRQLQELDADTAPTA